MVLLCVVAGSVVVSRSEESAVPFERSFWLHASLGLFTQRNYFGAEFAATAMPAEIEVMNAARLLSTRYAANRLYLIYHRELPINEARTLFRRWRAACPASVEIVPALVLRMYDKAGTPVWTESELRELAAFFRDELRVTLLAIYDIASKRGDQGTGLDLLAKAFPSGMIRLGLQPDESLDPPFDRGVADTWSAFCHGRRNEEDWRQAGFGAETLRKWVEARNRGDKPVVWDLVAVAWDYSATERGGYPGYDDAEKNMPLPAGRNRAAMKLIRSTARPGLLGGFSSDLYILHENSRAAAHDGRGRSFYESLKRGEEYRGYYAGPFQEIAEIYRELCERGE